LVISLEGCCSTIELHPQIVASAYRRQPCPCADAVGARAHVTSPGSVGASRLDQATLALSSPVLLRTLSPRAQKRAPRRLAAPAEQIPNRTVQKVLRLPTQCNILQRNTGNAIYV